jgi:hypothetical protein
MVSASTALSARCIGFEIPPLGFPPVRSPQRSLTVQLYLNGKIREWYSRGDGRGAVFLLDSKDVAEAHTIMDGLPLAKENLLDHDYIAVGPLFPLRLLMANP